MNEILPLDSSLPWLWFIEYLAGFKQVDTNILNALIERAPDLPGDPGKNARERVALRCLEELFGPIVRLAGGVTPASGVHFDLSQSCEGVLQCILQESSVLDLKNPRPELLKWDLYPFIMHKRATLPKCALEELKDTILSGTHPYAAALKEISGLVSNNETDGVTVCDDHHDALTMRPCESSSNAQTVPAKSNVAPLILENGNGILQHDFCLKNLLSSKRVRSELAAEDLVDVNNGNKDSLFGHDSLHLNAKKLNQSCQGSTYTNPYVGQISNPLLLEDACGRFRVAEVDCSALCKESQVGEHCNDDHIENSRDTNNICEIGDGSVQFVTVDETYNREPLSEYLEAKKRDRLARKKLSAVIHIFDRCSVKHIEGHRKQKNPTNRNGKDANCQFQRGLVDKQQSGPSIAFRDVNTPCVGDEANLLRIQESENLKEKEQNTRSQNRQDLSCQCQSCVADKQQPGFSASCRDISTQSMKDEANCIRMQENAHLKEREQNTRSQNRVFDCQFQRNLANEQQSGPSISCVDINKPYMENESNVCSGMVCIATIGREGKEKVVKENLSEREPEKQGAQLSDSPDYNIDNASSETLKLPLDVNTPCLEDETNVHSRTICIPTLGKESKEEVVKESLSEREPKRQGAQPFSGGPDYNSDNPSSQNTETAHLNQRQAVAGILGIPKEGLRQHRINPDQQPIVLNFDGEDTSDTENDEVIKLNYIIRFRRQQRKCTYLAVPQLRRKKVPWTIEEEQMLREGVSKFSSTAGGNIPWKEILDLGSSVFLNCRTSVDLKHKWRNMCKGGLKLK
ncbi:hypothetical protein SLA2020_387220 [Shorea laevis]